MFVILQSLVIFAKTYLFMKRYLDILGIILPLFLLLMPLVQLIFFDRRKKQKDAKSFKQLNLFNFSSVFIIVVLLFVGILRFLFFSGDGKNNFGEKPKPIAVSKHSDTFNESLQKILDDYYSMTDAFANIDTSNIKKYSSELKFALDTFNLDDLKKDSLIYLSAQEPVANMKAELESIISDPSMDEKKGSLNILSDNLRDLLVTVKYNLAKVYWEQCDEAFGDQPGNWLSKTAGGRNPYPLKENKDCGAPIDTLNYMTVDATKNN